jgi:hypothetical protein
MNSPFDNIKLSQLYILCNALAVTQVRHVSNIKRKYLESALSFEETLSLLEELKIVKNNSDELSSTKTFSTPCPSIDEFKKRILPVLFAANGDISEHLRTFLLNFETDTQKTYFNASDLQKIKFSDTRNLLLELDFISVSEDNSTYFINPEYTDLFLKQFSRRKLAPETLKRKQTENDAIGLAAEKAVIEFEIGRLIGISFNQDEIEHTSQENALAGYDIKSFENHLDENSKYVDRFIEVKAVSIDDFKFYWSRNEMGIAKVLGEKYFLYLLPVISSNTFDFSKLMIINNPFKNIYSNKLHWEKEEESVSFSKKL